MDSWKKEHVLLGIVVFIALLLLMKTVRLPHNGTIKVTLMPQKGGISTIDTPKNIYDQKSFEVDSINFLNKTVLEHPGLGVLGYSSNFFMELTSTMKVTEAGDYFFDVASDDGFRFWIDNAMVCEHPGDRPFQTTTCKKVLNKGTHLVRLEYFQGGGPMGLKVLYRHSEQSSPVLVGKSSRYISFEEPK